VLGHALGVPGFPVDRHVLRVTARLGLIHTDDAVKAEAALTALYPKALWTRVSDTFILHGRRICGPTPSCDLCHARQLCPHAVTGTRRQRPAPRRPATPAGAPTAPRAGRAGRRAAAPPARRRR